MARTIESPGVEIREIDLSNITTLPIGTNILLQGFAGQGPTDELLNITSIQELERIYGTPTTPAERYFYQSAKEVLNSPGRLLVNRLPYGDGTGYGTSPTRSALVYPVVPVMQTSVVNVTSYPTVTDTFTNNLTAQYTLNGQYVSGITVAVLESVSGQGTDVASVSGQYLISGNLAVYSLKNPSINLASVVLSSVPYRNFGTYSEVYFNEDYDVNTMNLAIQYSLSASEVSSVVIQSSAASLLTLADAASATVLSLSAQFVGKVITNQPGVNYTNGFSLTPGNTAVDYLKGYVFGAPILIPNLSAEQLTELMNGQFYSSTTSTTYNRTQMKALVDYQLAEGDYTENTSALFNLGKHAGMIIVNSNSTNVEDNYTGYYIGVNDNYNIDKTLQPYDRFKYLYTRNGDGSYTRLQNLGEDVTLATSLTGTDSTNTGSVSEIVEIGPAFSTTYAANSGLDYRHCLEFSLWKVYESQSETQGNDVILRTYYNVGPFIGGFVKRGPGSTDTLNNPYGGQSEQSIFVEESYITSGGKPWIEVYVNPLIKNVMDKSKFVRTFSNTTDFQNDPVITNLVNSTDITAAVNELNYVFANSKSIDGLFSIGPYAPTQDVSTKKIGNVVQKIERGLALAENVDLIPLELVLDAGLSTVFAVTRNVTQLADSGTYDDAVYFPSNLLEGQGSLDWLSVFNVLNNFCQNTRKDCMCIVDPLRHIFVQNDNTKVLSDKQASFSQDILVPLRNLVNACNSSYAAIYANWVKAYDSGSGVYFWAPFSGFEAAIMARMDALLQPWFAPAGLNNGIIRNIVDIAISPNQRERDLLYRFGLNPITSFPRDGFVVFGQKTLQAKPSAFDRINVRRLFLFLEKATRQIAKYFVFEPNTVFTRTRFVNVITPIFELAKRNQGVYDYLIVCDERNNTPDVIDRNELVVDIYIKPVRTAEFILINFIATRTGANFEEIISGTGA